MSVRTGVGAFVYLEVLGASEHFAAADEGTRERLLARVHAYVVDQLVLGLERLATAHTVVPVADVHVGGCCAAAVRTVGADVVVVGDEEFGGATDMVERQVGDDLVHAVEELVAHLLGVRVDPAAGVLHFGVRWRWWWWRLLLCHAVMIEIKVLLLVLLLVFDEAEKGCRLVLVLWVGVVVQGVGLGL